MGRREILIAYALAAMTPVLRAAASPGARQQEAPPIVIPPAVIGLDAASQELREALDESTLPATVPGLLAELEKRAGAIQQAIASGAFGQVWVPAMATKTVALALEPHASTLADRERAEAGTAIKQIVTAAWDLDTYGDLGNKEQLDAAFRRLVSGVSDLKSAYASR